MRQDETGLYPALEAALKASNAPQDCHDLYGIPDIASRAASVNRVSDYLGALWRKGKVVRAPAPQNRGHRTSWVYEWKGDRGPTLAGAEYKGRVLADRPSVLITEHGSVITLELPNLIVTIKQKPFQGEKYLNSLPRTK